MNFECINLWMEADKPHQVLQRFRENGWLRQYAPEIDRLYGVPQRPEHHPEIDVGLHVELTLEVASQLTKDPRVRYGALLHDLGKALTPPEEWPRHHGHEELGVQPGLELGRRFGVPEDWQHFGALVTRHHLRAHRALEATPRSLVRFFNEAGFFAQPELLGPFTLACEADARGRAGRADRGYPEGERLRQAFTIARAVTVEGSELQLHEARIRAVAAQRI